MKKQEMIDKLVEQGHDAEELKDKKNAELKEMLKADSADDVSSVQGDTGSAESDDGPKQDDEPAKVPGLADPIKTKAPKKAPQMMIPSTKKVMVVGKVYTNVAGAYIQPGKQCEIPENVHQEMVKTGRDKVLYSLK